MDDPQKIAALKSILLKEVSQFCNNGKAIWRRPIAATLREIKEQGWPAVFFGGTLRSLLLSRLKENLPGRPRDIDIVMGSATLDDLRGSFGNYISKENRFGGLQLHRIDQQFGVDWQFDMWPLKQTQALKEDSVLYPNFSDLPRTTFFNIEAIAVEVWPETGHARTIFSDDDSFFKGILSETIELNRESNPFPELCVVRTIIMAANLKWRLGPKLLRYVEAHSRTMSTGDFDSIQKKHYGRIQWDSTLFRDAIEIIRETARHLPVTPTRLPLPNQMTFWSEEDNFSQRINLRILHRKTKIRSKKASFQNKDQ